MLKCLPLHCIEYMYEFKIPVKSSHMLSVGCKKGCDWMEPTHDLDSSHDSRSKIYILHGVLSTAAAMTINQSICFR